MTITTTLWENLIKIELTTESHIYLNNSIRTGLYLLNLVYYDKHSNKENSLVPINRMRKINVFY